MNISPLTFQDIPSIAPLQPEGWLPIRPYFEFYTSTAFCFPLKYEVDGRIAGIGTAIVHGRSAWVAHIIVDKEFRNKGIGTAITRALMDLLKRMNVGTILLVATPAGEPVYRKLGFRKENEYVFLKDGKLPPYDGHVIEPLKPAHTSAVLELDRVVSGEDRMKLLEPHLKNGLIIQEDNKLQGFYLPTLGEGLIIAHTPEAGIELMRARHNERPYTAIPEENKAGIDYLINHGYKEFRRGTRMWIGERVGWRPDKLYGRIGGNLG